MGLKADTPTLEAQAPVLARQMSGCASTGQVVQSSLSSAAVGAGQSVLENALDDLGGNAVEAHQVLGLALDGLAQLVGSAATTYTGVDQSLTCPATPTATPSGPQPSSSAGPSSSPSAGPSSPTPSPSAQPSPTPTAGATP